MGNMQLRADFGMIQQAAGDIQTFRGNIDSHVEEVKSHALRQVDNLAGGMGADQLAAIKGKIDQLTDDYRRSLTTQQTSTENAGDTLHSAGRVAQASIANSAL